MKSFIKGNPSLWNNCWTSWGELLGLCLYFVENSLGYALFRGEFLGFAIGETLELCLEEVLDILIEEVRGLCLEEILGLLLADILGISIGKVFGLFLGEALHDFQERDAS